MRPHLRRREQARTRTGLVCLIAGMPKTRRQKLVSGGVLGEASGVFWEIFPSGSFESIFGRAFSGVFSVFLPDGAKSQKFF